jgi:formate dehydrogenase beta subunit
MQIQSVPISAIRKARNTLKGRQVSPQARAEVAQLLAASPRDRQYLIEYLHRIQDAHGHLSAAHLAALAEALKLAQTEVYEVATFYHHFDVVKEGEAAPPAVTIRVCDGIACEMAGAGALQKTLADKAAAYAPNVRVIPAPCVGQCDCAPMAVVNQMQVRHANAENVLPVVARHLDPAQQTALHATPSFNTQHDFAQLKACVSGARGFESVATELETAGLRGLGGAGFPAGRKWKIVRSFAGPRLMVVNADEGEPGTFKDRFYLERNAWQFIEGTLIAAWAVEAQTVYIYLRDEYHDLRRQLEAQLAHLRAHPPIPNMPAIEMRRGAGAYICGEESSLIESVEGKRGLPRLRPPYIAEVGVFGRPTLAHNVETLYWVPEILAKGAAWWSAQGRNARKGLRSYSVSGRVQSPGVKLAPSGVSLRELIDEFCGGMLPGHTLYGYLPGGASGGILPASLDNVPLDFDTLQPHGCFIGSAAIVVLSQHDTARSAALNLMRFFEHESCGQCTPCRAGTSKAVKLMQEKTWDQALLKELSQTMMDASICGLGQAAPNPLLCAMKYFPQEFGSELPQ